MLRAFVPAILCVALTSCDAGERANNEANGEGTVENAKLTKLRLTSDAFQNGQPIPVQYSCDGANQSPPLQWSEPPLGTRSFALVIDDPDAPGGTFHHWGAYDIPASTRSLAAGQAVGSQAVNDGGKPGYTGPCPPRGHGPHHYHFKLFALDVGTLKLSVNARVSDVEDAANKHRLGEAELIGTFERK